MPNAMWNNTIYLNSVKVPLTGGLGILGAAKTVARKIGGGGINPKTDLISDFRHVEMIGIFLTTCNPQET